MRLKVSLTVLFFIPFFLCAQYNSLRFNHYGVNDGLSQGNVTCIMQDHLGLMWFGTWDGLNMYDSFKNTTFKERFYKSEKIRGVLINNIIEVDSERVAIGSYSGLSIFNRAKQEFEYYSDGTGKNNIRLIKLQDHYLLLTINNKLMRFDLRTNQFSSVEQILLDRWKVLNKDRKNGVNRSEHLYTKLFELTEKMPDAIPEFQKILSDITVNDLVFDLANQRVFLGCDEGLFYYDLSRHKLSDPLISTPVKSLQNLENQLFVGTQSKGLIEFDMKSNMVRSNYTYNELSKRSVSGNFVRTMYIDKNQNLWLSLLGSGINYCSLKPKIANTIFTYSDLPLAHKQNNYIKALAEGSDSILWVATITGTIWLLDNENKTIKTILPKDIDPFLQPNSIQSFYINQNDQKFLLTEKGLYSYGKSGKFIRAKADSLDENQSYLQSMIALNDSLYLIGSRGGLLLYNEKENTLMAFQDSTFRSTTIHFLYKDRAGLVYVNRLFEGVEVFSLKNNQLNPIHSVDLKINLKYCHETNDTLYIATTKGIMVMSKRDYNYYFIDEPDGLPNQNVYCLLPDKTDTAAFWCSSNRGIFRYNIHTGNLFTLGLNDGLNSLEFNTSSFTVRKNGQYVFGGIDGLTILRPELLATNEEKDNLISYNLNFDKAAINEIVNFKNGNTFRIPYEHNGFSFRLLQVNFPNYDSPIRYQLKGHDKDWINASNPVEVRYSNLAEGYYDFVAQYYDRERGWISKHLFSIDLLPPWYRTWWAYSMYFIFIGGIIFMLNRIYINKRLQAKREALVRKEVLLMERDRISADLHDDLGSTLSSISIYTEAIKNKMQQHDSEKILELVERIGENARESITNLSDIVWSINPLNDSGELVLRRMESFATSVLASKNIELDFSYDKELLKKEFNLELRQNLLLVFKEAINNVVKYSGATGVVVSINYENRKLHLLISDNGHGFDINRVASGIRMPGSGGNGLRNMKLRSDQLKGQFDLKSTNSGTRVVLVVSLP